MILSVAFFNLSLLKKSIEVNIYIKNEPSSKNKR